MRVTNLIAVLEKKTNFYVARNPKRPMLWLVLYRKIHLDHKGIKKMQNNSGKSPPVTKPPISGWLSIQ